MTTFLQIDTSLNGQQSLSSSLASEYVQRRLGSDTRARLISRDLSASAIPHLTAEGFAGFQGKTEDHQGVPLKTRQLSDQLIDELREANEIVLALPMHNFGIPSTLKAWIDHVARAGETFRYTSEGPQGLLRDKKLVVFATRGGKYQGTDMDTQSSYLKNFFAFLGIENVEFVYAEGTAMGEEGLALAIDGARQRIEQLQPLAA